MCLRVCIYSYNVLIKKQKRCELHLRINEQILTPKGADHALRKAHVLRAINEQAPPMSVMHIMITNRNVLWTASSKEPT